MTAIKHPAWCDRALCTAPAGQPTEHGPRGHHLSAPVALDIREVRIGGMVPVGEVTAQLRQGVAQWPCEPYVRITFGGYGDDGMDVTVIQAAAAAAVLGELAAAASTDFATAAAARELARGRGAGRVHLDLTGLEAAALIRAAGALLNGGTRPGGLALIGREAAALTRARHKLSTATSANLLCTARTQVHEIWLTCDADQHPGPEHHDPSGLTWRADS